MAANNQLDIPYCALLHHTAHRIRIPKIKLLVEGTSVISVVRKEADTRIMADIKLTSPILFIIKDLRPALRESSCV